MKLEKLLKDHTASFNNELLGKIEAFEDELATEKNRKVQNHLCVESPGENGS